MNARPTLLKPTLALLLLAAPGAWAAGPVVGAAERSSAVYWVADGVRLGRPAALRTVVWVPGGFRAGPVLRAAMPALAPSGGGAGSGALSPAALPAVLPAVDVARVVDDASRDWAAQLLGTAGVAGLD